MLLQRLVDYSYRIDPLPTLYVETPIRYIVDLNADGTVEGRTPIDTADPANRSTTRGRRRPAPQIQRAASVKSLLLADNAEYTLGLPRPESRPTRVVACHAAYRALVDRCWHDTQEPAVDAVRTFLAADPSSQLDLPKDFDRGALITFRVHGTFPIDLPSVQQFWASANDPGGNPDRPAKVMQCVVCGETRPVLDRLQGKIKGIRAGQTSGTSIISANSDAFESYGLTASLVAPTCASCGERFTKAANSLIADQAHCLRLGGAEFIFWTREDVGFDLLTYFQTPQSEDVRGLLESVRSGRQAAEIDDTKFYATVLSGSGGRAVVRDWIDTTVGDVRSNLARWFVAQRIVDPYGEAARPFGLFGLAAATVRDASKDLAPPTPRALLSSALTGNPLPFSLLYQAVRRNRAEQ
ncbi:MAG TPA: type I-C CRISPR-associated protein Cas8c/Csd1, partial [Chloroflexota bacterium]|nr:type I-C CRISPR-associated protein Cas8c/Csd1 [Chloroflexota bacterium]